MLYVPRHWWHYVESVDPITVSVNSWIELVSNPHVSPSSWTIQLKTWNNEKLFHDFPAQCLVLPDDGPSQLWVMNRPGSKRFSVIMMSVSAQRGVCAAWKKLPSARQTFIQRAGPSPAFPARSPTQQTVPAAYLHAVSLSFSAIILICSIHSYCALAFCSCTGSGWRGKSQWSCDQGCCLCP